MAKKLLNIYKENARNLLKGFAVDNGLYLMNVLQERLYGENREGFEEGGHLVYLTEKEYNQLKKDKNYNVKE